MEQGQPICLDSLPRKCDVLRHIWFHGDGKATREAINKTTSDLIQIWEKADCPPKSRESVIKQIDNLLKDYREPNKLRESRGSKIGCSKEGKERSEV